MGYGTTRTLERMAAAIGMLDGAPIEFERVQDVPDGGVLFALPALLENGLLSGTEKIYTMSEGFYPIETIFLLLALMALARIASLEGLRYVIAGEWGKLLGLDRIPEVRTLRHKIGQLCSPEGRAERWSSQLARQWMADSASSPNKSQDRITTRIENVVEIRASLPDRLYSEISWLRGHFSQFCYFLGDGPNFCTLQRQSSCALEFASCEQHFPVGRGEN
jgi:Transposase protein